MKRSSTPLSVAITMGDPSGVGPEVVVKALASKEVAGRVLPIVVGSVRTLERAALLAGVAVDLVEVSEEDSPIALPGIPSYLVKPSHRRDRAARIGRQNGQGPRAYRTHLGFWNVGRKRHVMFVVAPPGLPSGSSPGQRGEMAFACVKEAVRLCAAGRARAVVTAPISKVTLAAAGLRFAGHTEMLRELCGVRRTVMMFVSEELRVSLVTTHTPIGRLARELDRSGVEGTLGLTHTAMRRLFGVANPRLAVLALNPHAGEAGLLGEEEERVIKPAIRAARRKGVVADGPFPADSFFSRGKWKDFDAAVAMYHDQALIPAKLLAGDRAVNLTLGLPFVRTSPGHGTAEDLAWRGRALAEGMISAILLAASLSEKVRLPLRWD